MNEIAVYWVVIMLCKGGGGGIISVMEIGVHYVQLVCDLCSQFGLCIWQQNAAQGPSWRYAGPIEMTVLNPWPSSLKGVGAPEQTSWTTGTLPLWRVSQNTYSSY